ncbi:MAG: hypothetical protein LBV74_09920 [Tannerella sp.]|nr:hypothetical protein [Tannerella sp.]
MEQLREAASHCKTRTDYVEFLNERLPVTFTETTDGIIMHFGDTILMCTIGSVLAALYLARQTRNATFVVEVVKADIRIQNTFVSNNA